MRVIAMIPARLGSKRIKRKNLRLLGNKPLLQWVADTACNSGLFKAVWINSESPDIGELAARLHMPWYRRPQMLATDLATNDDFMDDFITSVATEIGCTHVAQINPTSPFLTTSDMYRALELARSGATTVISVRRLLAECRAYMREVNYDPTRPMLPSQDLAPVHYFCNGIFVWEIETFLQARKLYKGAATYGPLGVTEYLELDGDSTIDLDNEEDWQKAELIVRRRSEPDVKARYWTPTLEQECKSLEAVVCDGVLNVTHAGGSLSANGVLRLAATLASPSFPENESECWRVAQQPSFVATVISQLPGEGNRRHYHPDCDELWYILEGSYQFVFGNGSSSLVANAGDLVTVQRGVWHQITAIGDKRAVRLAVSKEGAAHVYHD